jgi:hypothetical protein
MNKRQYSLHTYKWVLVSLFASIMVAQRGIAQSAEKNYNEEPIRYLYAGGHIGPALNGYTYGVGLNSSVSNTFGVSIWFHEALIEAKALPENYVAGLCVFDCVPRDRLSLISLRMGYDFPQQSPKIRYTIEAGPSFGWHYKRKFGMNPNASHGFFMGSNYISRTEQLQTVGLSIRTKAAWLLARFMAMELGVQANINQDMPYIGIDFQLSLGKTRNKLKAKNVDVLCVEESNRSKNE